jgi:hypothetical protein
VSRYTKEERIERMAQLLESSREILEEYRDLLIEGYHERLDVEPDHGTVRFIQGHIAGVRDFLDIPGL